MACMFRQSHYNVAQRGRRRQQADWVAEGLEAFCAWVRAFGGEDKGGWGCKGVGGTVM